MAEEGQNGGTPEQSGDGAPAPETYTKEQVEQAVAQAQQQAWSHFQSVKDKEVNEVKSKAEQAVKAYQDMVQQQEQQKLESMSPEEKAAYFAQKTYEATLNGGSQSHNPSDGASSASAAGAMSNSQEGAAQGQVGVAGQPFDVINNAVKELGLDPTKVDFSGGLQGFLKSVVAQASASAKSPEEQAKENNQKVESERQENPVTPANGGPSGGPDLLKMSPADAIRGALGGKSPWSR